MVEEKFCQGCSQRNKCEEVYGKLAGFEGPSVAWKATVAFLLPMVVFIVALAIFEEILSGWEIRADLRGIFGVVGSLLVTAVFVLIVRAGGREINLRAK